MEASVIQELQVREKMIDEIKSKVKVYRDCIEATEMHEALTKFKDVTCFSDFEAIVILNQHT